MPAPPLSNTFAGGTNGTQITTGNSGGTSGNAFSSVTASSIITYANTLGTSEASGSGFAMSIAQTGTYAATFAAWTGLGSLTGRTYARLYFYMPAAPNAHMSIATFLSSAALFALSLEVTTGRLLQFIHGNSGAVLATGSVAIPTGQLVRVDFDHLPGTSGADGHAAFYAGLTSNTADDSISFTGAALRADVDAIDWGMRSPNAGGPASQTFYWRDVSIQTSAYTAFQSLPFVNVTVR